MIAVPAGLSAAGIKDKWWTGLIAGAAIVLAVLAKPLTDRLQRLTTRHEDTDLAVLNGCLVTARGDFPTVRRIRDPRQLGVHPAGSDSLPTYVPRDVDDKLRSRIARGGFVLLVGDSTAGKTRAAYEAIAATVPDHVIIAPKDCAALWASVDRGVQASNCVVWLNDLEHYLGSDGVSREMLARLLSGKGHRIVVATIRAVELARFSAESSGDGLHIARAALELVDEEIRVERRLSNAEQSRAEERKWDPHIADALQHSGDYGLAEYLAAGPELLRDWRNGWDVGAHPRGAALVAAAVDVRRAGLNPPLAGRLLEETAEEYLRKRGGDRLRPESLEAAWEWVLRPRRATTSLMIGTPRTGFDVFDYLVDVTQRETTPDTFVPESVLRAAVQYATGQEALAIGRTADHQGYYGAAADAHSAALRWAGDHLDPAHPDTLTSRNGLALALHNLGRLDKAEEEHRAVLELRIRVLGPEDRQTLTSRHNLACALRDLGRLDEAEQEFRTVIEIRTRVWGAEHQPTLISRSNLATTLRRMGRFDEAEREHRTILDSQTRTLGSEHPLALISRHNLAMVLGDMKQLLEAEREFQTVLEIRTRVSGPEHPHTLASRGDLAYVLLGLGRPDEAERELRAVVELRTRVLGSDHPDTVRSRDSLARVRKRIKEAEG
ncbi:tetratricopeptide repeat protein [Kutzneria sp. 744]|uniref:tetratricopeptide repeat protein n=1 Tax=Kutzneria sp. (strain 744) TaxID=345341 RepID=UPI000693E5BD|nr:tetratricopeptide repeat protein [Kutzneria sp. 744]